MDAVVDFCRGRVESFYREICGTEPPARYFAEKIEPTSNSECGLRDIYPDLSKIVLVRDFRDMFTSVLAFNAKRNSAALGRQLVTSDENLLYFLAKHADALLFSLHEDDGRSLVCATRI